LYAYLNLPIKRHKGHYFVLIGLFFSMIGDATLNWFVVGLTFFLIGHLAYIYAFLQWQAFKKSHLLLLVILLPYGIWIGWQVVINLIDQDLSGLIAPVLLYILVILMMGFVAFLTKNYFIFIGAVLFILSDSILAWNRFVEEVEFSGILIMSTYYLAQFALATSLRKREETVITPDLPT